MQKRPLFIVITMAAKVTNKPLRVSQVRSHKGSHLWGGVDRTGDPIVTNALFHAMYVILSLKLRDQ